MTKPEKLWRKLGCLAAIAGLYGIWLLFDLPCVPRTLTGIPCITCGLTRAWLAVLRLDLRGAFLQYPMFWSIPLLVLYFLFDGHLFPGRKVNNGILGMILAGLFVIYFARLLGFLGGLSPL